MPSPTNQKVPLTSLENFLGFAPGPSHGPAAIANLRPYRVPGTRARLGIATSLPAFVYGTPPAGVDPCSDTSAYYMRCLDRLGANIVIQDEANPGQWTGSDGNGIEKWQPLSWMSSTDRAVQDPAVHFAYNVTAMMVGNLADLVFDGQSAVTQRGDTRGPGCAYIGNRRFVPGEDQTMFRALRGSEAVVSGHRAVGRGAIAPALPCARWALSWPRDPGQRWRTTTFRRR